MTCNLEIRLSRLLSDISTAQHPCLCTRFYFSPLFPLVVEPRRRQVVRFHVLFMCECNKILSLCLSFFCFVSFVLPFTPLGGSDCFGSGPQAWIAPSPIYPNNSFSMGMRGQDGLSKGEVR